MVRKAFLSLLTPVLVALVVAAPALSHAGPRLRGAWSAPVASPVTINPVAVQAILGAVSGSYGMAAPILGFSPYRGGGPSSLAGLSGTIASAQMIDPYVPVDGTADVTGAIAASSTVQGTQLISTQTTGTAPLTVSSTTAVTNLNADAVDGVS